MPIDPIKRDPETGRLYFIRADHEEVRCDDILCAGMTLHAAIDSARKNQKNVLGLNGTSYGLLAQYEVDAFRKMLTEAGKKVYVCEHEMWQVLDPTDIPLPNTCESA